MTPLAIGALLAVAAMVWVIAPIFGERPDARGPDRAVPRSLDGAANDTADAAADAAAEAAIRRWREPRG